jgi:hypothetical protein
MANEFKYTLTFDSRSTGNGITQTLGNINQLQQHVQRTTDASARLGGWGADTVTAGMTRMQKSTGNAANSLLLFSQGFEDAQYGMRGVLNNIPGLVMSLGMGAGVAGALSIAAVGVSMLGKYFGATAEKATEFQTALTEGTKAAAESIGQINTERIEETSRKLALATESAILLSKRYAEVETAQNKAAESELDNASKALTAQNLVAEALGRQVDQYQQIADLAEIEAAKREEAARQEIAAENAKAAAAAKESWVTTQRAGDMETQKTFLLRDLEYQREKLEILRGQAAEFERLSKGAQSGNPLNDLFDFEGRDNRRVGTQLGSQVQGQLSYFQNLVDSTEAAIRSVDQKIAAMAGTVDDANRAATDVIQSVGMQIETIQTTLAQDDLNARAKAAAEQSKVLAQGLQTGLTDVNGNLRYVVEIMQQFQVRQAATLAELKRIDAEQKRQAAMGTSPLPAR